MTSLKTSIKTITYLSDIGCLEIQGASLPAHQKLLFTSVEPGRYAVKIKDIVTGCSQISEEMLFTEQTSGREVSYTEGSLTLYPVRNGNTHLSEITDSQF